MKLWIDDNRVAPHGWVLAKSASEAIEFLKSKMITEISFDHDLGDSNSTGYTVACFIEKAAYDNDLPAMVWNIHSSNPVGRKRIEAAMTKADEYWKKKFTK